MAKAISEDLRKRIVSAYINGEESQREVAKRFEVSEDTVKRLIAQFNRLGHIQPKPHSGGKTQTKLLPLHTQALKDWVFQNPSLTLRQLSENLQTSFGLHIHPDHLSKVLRKLGLSRKKKVLYDPKIDTVELKAERLAWKSVLKILIAHSLKSLVFIDETGLRTQMTPSYGYSPVNQRLRSPCRKRAAHYTLIAALTLDGVIAQHMFRGAMKLKDLKKWIKDVLLPLLKKGMVVIWDNLRLHWDLNVRRLFWGAKISVHHQSRYSPDFNPIELLWSKLKTLIRKQEPRTLKQLRHALALSLAHISIEDIRGFYRHSGIWPNDSCSVATA